MTNQYRRKANLLIVKPELKGDNSKARVPEVIQDLSEMHFQFTTKNQDEEGPANCSIRVFNLSDSMVETLIKWNYENVIVQAGYEGQFGVVFQGNIKQFRTGRLNATDKYLDILAADGDLGYNFSTVSQSFLAGVSAAQRRDAALAALALNGVTLGKDLSNLSSTGGTLPRGKVYFGMARAVMRQESEAAGCTWSIQNGKINIIPYDAYLPGDAVVLTAGTGLIGLPEQTQDGIKVRCLMNPKIEVGGRIKLDNAAINKTVQQGQTFFIPYNQYASPQFLASVAKDGYYRVYVAEHTGDTRGQEWYTDLVCLAIDPITERLV